MQVVSKQPIDAAFRFLPAIAVSAGGNGFIGIATKQRIGELVDSDGDSLLNVAISYLQPTFAKRLIDAGVSTNRADHDGNSTLHQAVMVRKTEIVSWLLAAHAKIDVQNRAGETPLLLAIRNQDRPTIAALIKAGADPDIKDELGNTARAEANRLHLPNEILQKDVKSL